MNQEVDILVNGKPVKQIPHDGKLFIVAKEGSQYEIRLRNHSTNRITGVVSVDGVNVVDGERAVPKGGGYIIPGYGSYIIKGYRTSNEEVHPFIFSPKHQSYAEKSENGDVQDCGVIGVIFWNEKYKAPKVIEKHIHHDHYYPVDRPYPIYPPIYPYKPHQPWEPRWTCQSGLQGNSSVSCLSNSGSLGNGILRSTNMSVQPPTEFDLGTKFSDQVVSDRVETVDFDWGQQAGQITIYYASKEMLITMGVSVEKESKVTFPSPFQNPNFCKPPKK